MDMPNITSTDTFDLVDSHLVFETNADTGYGWFIVRVGDFESELAAYMFYRLSVSSSGSLSLEESIDGQLWSVKATETVDPLFYRSVRIVFSSDYSATTNAVLGSINMLPVVNPKISTLVQDFSDVNKYDPDLWSTYATGTGSASVDGGYIYTSITGGGSSFASVSSVHRYDMRDSEVILDMWHSPGASVTIESDYGYMNGPFSTPGVKKAKYDTSTKTMTIWDFDSGTWNLEDTIPDPFMGDPGLDQDLAASSVSIRVSSSTAVNTINNAIIYSINVDPEAPETPEQGNFLLFF